MYFIKKKLLFLFVLVVHSMQLVHSNNSSTSFLMVVKYIQKITGSYEEEFYEKLWYRYQNPLDLNTATYQELKELSFITKKQLRALVDYREKGNFFSSIYELQALPYWDVPTIKLLQSFVTILAPEKLLRPIEGSLDQRKVTLGFQRSFFVQPEKEEEVLGDASKLFFSYRQSRPQLYSIGFLAKKDPKEPISTTSYLPPPYCSGHIMLEQQSLLKKFIIGDYYVGFGQGLITKSGFTIDKTAEAIYVLRANQKGITPNLSHGRKVGFRGMATTLSISDVDLTLYASKRKLDAKIQREGHVRSIASRGCVYSNENALKKRNAFEEKIAGAVLSYCPHPNLELGVQVLGYWYSHPILPRKNYYNADHFQGKEGGNFGAFGNFLWKNIHFFGELALSKNKAKAVVGGAMLSLGKRIDAALLVRSYDSDFHAMYGRGFGKNTRNINEEGLYLGIKIVPLDKLCITGYVDIFRHLKPQYRAHRGTEGKHWLASVNYQPTRDTLLQLKLKNTCQPYNRSRVSTFQHPILDMHQRTVLHGKFSHAFSRQFQIRTGIQFSRYTTEQGSPSYGAGVIQSLVYKKNKITFKPYIALFYAPIYGTRLYFYMPGVFRGINFPMLYGRGGQAGLIFKCPLSKKLSVSLKLSLDLFYRKDQFYRKPFLSFQLTWK